MVQQTSALGLCDFEAISPCKLGMGNTCLTKTDQSTSDLVSSDNAVTGHTTAVTKSTEVDLATNRISFPTRSDTRLTMTDQSTSDLVSSDNAVTGHTTAVTKSTEVDLETNSQSSFARLKTHQVNPKQATSDLVDNEITVTEHETTPTAFCPSNMVYTNCTTCQGTCQNPTRCKTICTKPESCVCSDGFLMKGQECVLETECLCFKEGYGVIAINRTFVSDDCSERCDCHNETFSCNSSYKCSPNATCRTQDGVRQCYCNAGYEGDGETCTEVIFKDCNDVFNFGHNQDGVYSIIPVGWPGPAFDVFCNITADGKAWTVFQRRSAGSTNFYKTWDDYKSGFGNAENEFWLGNEKLHYLTHQSPYELRIECKSSSYYFAEYNSFQIGEENENFRLYVGTLKQSPGVIGDGFSGARNLSFSTYDKDNDELPYNCAEKHRGGWWYGGLNDYREAPGWNDCRRWQDGDIRVQCTHSNLNGEYNGGPGQNIFWSYSWQCNTKSAEMKVHRL